MVVSADLEISFLERFHKCLYRFNVVGPVSNGKSTVVSIMITPGITGTHFTNPEPCTVFSTEFLLTNPENKHVTVQVEFIPYELLVSKIQTDLKDCFNSAAEKLDKVRGSGKESMSRVIRSFINTFINRFNTLGSIALIRFFESKTTTDLFETIDLESLGRVLFGLTENEFININFLEDYWENYFSKLFEIELNNKYHVWKEKIAINYNMEPTEYHSEREDITSNSGLQRIRFKNQRMNELFKLLHGMDSSCAFMVSRVYIEVPASEADFEGIVMIDNAGSTQDEKSEQQFESDIVGMRMEESYKEGFILVGECSFKTDTTKLIGNLKLYELLDRSAFIVNRFDEYMYQQIQDEEKMYDYFADNYGKYDTMINRYGNDIERLIRTGEGRDAYLNHLDREQQGGFYSIVHEKAIQVASGIPSDNIIVTSWLRDVVPGQFASPEHAPKTDLLKKLISNLKIAVGKIASSVIISKSSLENGFELKLDIQDLKIRNLVETVQKLHQNQCIFLWDDLIKCNKNPMDYGNITDRPFWFVTIDSIIRCRKDAYKGYRHITKAQVYANYRGAQRDIYFGMLERKQIKEALVELGKRISILIPEEAYVSDKVALEEAVENQVNVSFIQFVEYFYLKEITGIFFPNGLEHCLKVEQNFTIQHYQKAIESALNLIMVRLRKYQIILQ